MGLISPCLKLSFAFWQLSSRMLGQKTTLNQYVDLFELVNLGTPCPIHNNAPFCLQCCDPSPGSSPLPNGDPSTSPLHCFLDLFKHVHLGTPPGLLASGRSVFYWKAFLYLPAHTREPVASPSTMVYLLVQLLHTVAESQLAHPSPHAVTSER